MTDTLGHESTIHEIEYDITQLQLCLPMASRSDHRRLLLILMLALRRFLRHSLLKQRDDLDKSIVHFTESILLPPHSWAQHDPTIFRTLFLLAAALFMRSKESNQPEDAICSAKYLSHIRDQPHEISDVPRHQVTTALVNALALQVELEAGDVMENIREMAILCRELLTLQTSKVDTTHIIHVMYEAVLSKIAMRVPGQPLDEIIECLRAARKHRPDVLEGCLALGKSLMHRYCMAFENDDYDEAISIFDVIASSSPGDSQDEFLAAAQAFATEMATTLAGVRSTVYQTPEYLEETIYRARSSLSSSSVKKFYPSPLFYPEDAAKWRSAYFGSIGRVEASSGRFAPLFQPLAVQSPFFQAVDKMDALILGLRNNDEAGKIDETIEKGRTILAPYSPTDSTHGWLFYLFGDMLLEAFELTKKIEYLNESITAHRQALEDPFAQILPSAALLPLSRNLLVRFVHFPGYRRQDVDEGLELYSRCVGDTRANFVIRFMNACEWAYFARLTRHSSVSTAYETAVSFMQDTLHFSPTLQLQHVILATGHRTHTSCLPVDYASYQIELYKLEEAIETLERGRALLWSEMRHLRTSIDQLLEANPDLGHKFAAVNRDLEELTKSVAPSHELRMDDGASDDLKAVDPFGRLVLERRRLLKERGKVISQIQALPGFEGFLTSPSFNALRSAASSGPVIIINRSKWRSDILVLHDTSLSLIPTPNDFYDRARAFKDKLLNSRHKYGLDSTDYEEALAPVLAGLYNLVGKPVIDRLRQLQVPEQSRIWWCPTSVFCSLPLHAMGPIPSGDGESRYFLDLYICSYTPTLSALIQSRNRHSGSRSSSDRPSILLVAQPDDLPTVRGEIQVVQALDTEVTSFISAAATPSTVIEGFRHHQFVHFACHGSLEAGKPFEAGFELYRHERLSLLEIVRAHLPAAEFAFLSACHTAEMTEGSLMDEGLHLAAAVQYCGFRSVVGTMWAMADLDGRDLAKNFYKALLSNPRGVPYHERSAKALQFAVKKLRGKRHITLERWVNFVHYGA